MFCRSCSLLLAFRTVACHVSSCLFSALGFVLGSSGDSSSLRGVQEGVGSEKLKDVDDELLSWLGFAHHVLKRVKVFEPSCSPCVFVFVFHRAFDCSIVPEVSLPRAASVGVMLPVSSAFGGTPVAILPAQQHWHGAGVLSIVPRPGQPRIIFEQSHGVTD